MKKFKENEIILLFLLLGPFLDVSSFLGSPLSMIIRGIFLMFAIIILIIRKKNIKVLLPLLIFGIISLFYQHVKLNIGWIASISSVLKFLYLPVGVLYFKDFVFPIDKEKIFSIILGTYIGLYLLSYIFQFGSNVYLEAVGKSGFKGVFSSVNEFSAILVCLLPISSTYLKNRKKYLFLGMLLISILFCNLLTGTKILFGGLLFCILYLLWQERDPLFFKQKKSIQVGIITGSILLIIIGGFLFTKTSTYQNMKVQQNFFKVEKIISLEFINKVIYNDRLTFLEENIEYFQVQRPINWLLGIGVENPMKLVEIDIFDILIRYGVIGLFIFVGTTIYVIKWQDLKEQEKVAWILLILVSLTSGHVLIYPAVSIYFGLICCNRNSEKQKNPL